MTQVAETVEIESAPSPDAAVIWLHGLGADGHDFEPVVPELRLPPQLRALIRNARREQAESKPPRAYRELFRVIREAADE